MRILRRLVLRWFVPNDLQTDAETRRQAVRTILFGLAMVFWVPIFAPIYSVLGSPRTAVMLVFASVAVVASMVSLRITKSVFLTGNLITGVVFSVLVAIACVSGGIGAASLWWLPSVPIVALVLSGIRSGVLWAVISCVASITFFGLANLEIALPSDISAENYRLLDCAAMCGIILCAFSLTLVFKLGEAAARSDLEAARDASEQANKAKSEFLANMSHEIRTPMNAIVGMTDLILATDLTRDQREHLNIVQDSSESLLVLIDDILDFSKIGARRLKLNRKPFDLHESIAHATETSGIQARKRSLELASHVGTDVPRIVVGDQVRLRQVVANLVDNAIKFTEQGEVVFKVRCGERTEQSVCLNFSVADTGIGIPAEKQKVIFNVFEQVDMSSTRRFGGTGLGLAICSQLVQMMGGQICVESEVGRGSIFHFTAVFGLTNEDTLHTSTIRRESIHNTRVLIVDDNESDRATIADMLRSWGIAPTVAEDVSRTLGLLRQAKDTGEPYHLVLTDAHMSDIDGFTLAQQIKEDSELTCAVLMMLTAGDKASSAVPCERLGIASYLFKPVSQPALLDAIVEVLGITSPEDEGADSPGVETPNQLDPLDILLVEDSLMNQKLAATVLRNQGHNVSIANNGREALEALDSETFHLVLMDIQMPEMDGLEATRAIRDKERTSGEHIPVIALTAHALEGDRERCLDAGMDEYTTKPLHAKKLMETIDAILGRQ